MPFKEQWREFQSGDLVYGIETSAIGGHDRASYIKKWRAESQSLEEASPPRIDNYRILKKEQSRDTDSAAETPWERSMKKTLLEHPKYGDAVSKTASRSSPELNSLVRKKDKGGLYWASFIAGKHVHFILDGLNMLSVIQKSFTKESLPLVVKKGKLGNFQGGVQLQFDRPATHDQQKVRSITGSELRWVYRHRDHPNVQAYIQFWSEGKPCVPPWEHWMHVDPKTFEQSEIHELWTLYQPRQQIQIHHDTVELPGTLEDSDSSGMVMRAEAHGGGAKKSCGGCTLF